MDHGFIKKLPYELTTIATRMTQDMPTAGIYLVGGAVRDVLLDRTTKDYDLVVTQVTAAKLEAWLADHGQVNLVGRNFGVFKWQPAGWSGEAIDVALPRTEHTAIGSGQYRDFNIATNPELPIEEDLKRRDFTINAMALNLMAGNLVDPAYGQADLTRGVLRAVGDPNERLAEDLSRALRGLRQACQLGFTIEPATWQAISASAARAAQGKLHNEWLVPREVVARELLKSLLADPARALELWDEAGLVKELLPEVWAMHGSPQPPEFHSEGDVFEHTKLALGSVGGPEWQSFFGSTKPTLNVLLATLLHDIGKPLTIKTPDQDGTERIRTNGHDVAGAALVTGICQRLKLTSYVDQAAGQITSDSVAWLVQHHLLVVHGSPDVLRPATIYRYFLKDAPRGLELQQVIFLDMHATRPADGRTLTGRLKQLRERIAEVSQTLTVGKLKLVLTGDEIMNAFKLRPGPQIGRLLGELEEAQLEGKVTTREVALNYLATKL